MLEPQILCRMCDNKRKQGGSWFGRHFVSASCRATSKKCKKMRFARTGVLPFIRKLHV